MGVPSLPSSISVTHIPSGSITQLPDSTFYHDEVKQVSKQTLNVVVLSPHHFSFCVIFLFLCSCSLIENVYVFLILTINTNWFIVGTMMCFRYAKDLHAVKFSFLSVQQNYESSHSSASNNKVKSHLVDMWEKLPQRDLDCSHKL